MKPVSAVLVGAGQRGRYAYGSHALANPAALDFVAVVDPDQTRRTTFGDLHEIPAKRRFAGFAEALDVAADAWVVATPDREHFAPAAAALGAGIPVLLEKPIAATIGDTVDLVAAADATGVLLTISHVLRYTAFFSALSSVVTSGRIGDIVTVEHRENVAAWHMAHSFVRGNWAHAAEATPMIVAKSCHDFDVLSWNLASPVRTVSSVGSLLHFRPEHAPAGATERCSDGCPADGCPFDARRIYLNEAVRGWPVHVVTDDLSREGRLRALRDGPYGRCVYRAESDVVDHQVVSMQLESGASVTLTMHGHSHEEARTMRYDGTMATLRAVFGRTQVIEIGDHASGAIERVPIRETAGGHGGGDTGVIDAFVRAVRSGDPPLTSAADSLESHYLAFAAEEARTSGGVIAMGEYRSRYPC